MPLLRSSSELSCLPLLCILLALTSSCGTTFQWRSIEKEQPFEELWFEVARLAGSHGFPPNHAQTDRGKRVYVSVWREYPAPFRFGRRSRFKARFLPQHDGSGWLIEFHIQQQMVKDIARGFEAREEDWSDSGQDFGREATILGQLRLFRNRSGSSSSDKSGLAIVNRSFDQPQARRQ